jgi:hypothetical protein
MPRAGFLLIAMALACAAEVRVSRFQNRDAWTIDGGDLRVTILQSGGHVGEIVLKRGGMNPLWIPRYATIDPERYDPVRDEKTYGSGSAARLMSGLLGHNVCFPFWGDPSDRETRAGMTYHGETGIVRWREKAKGGDWLTVAAELPESAARFTRTVRVSGQTVAFDETAESTTAWDRPVGWCEHVTLGPGFLEPEETLTDASLTRGRDRESGAEFSWPDGQAETRINLAKVRTTPRPGFVNNFLVDPAREFGFFTAFNPRQNLLFGYVFPRADFPWLNIWENNDARMLTRGMEFSNTPTHGTMKVLVKAPTLFGTPAYEWLDAKGKLRKRYLSFSTQTPTGYRGVADVKVTGTTLEIVERGTGRIIRLATVSAF